MVNLIHKLCKMLKVASARGKYKAKQETSKCQTRAREESIKGKAGPEGEQRLTGGHEDALWSEKGLIPGRKHPVGTP